jgi:hypothetical protein
LRQSTKIHTQYQGLRLLFYRAALPLSRRTLNYVTGIVRRHRRSIGSRWRKLDPGQQALLVLAYLRRGETFAALAAGFGVGTSTAWRYVEETVALLTARAPKLRKAVRDAKKAGYAYVILDGTLIPIDRVAADKPVMLRKARETQHEPAGHRWSAQGEVLWVSGALPGVGARQEGRVDPGRPGRAGGRGPGHAGRQGLPGIRAREDWFGS